MKKNPLFIVIGLSALFFVVFLAVAVGTVMSLSPTKPQKKLFAKANNIGVLEVKGVIMDSKKMLEQIETFEEDPLIKGVVVRVNSPGGAVAPSQEIYEAFKKLGEKKPVYTSMGNVAASGGYYVACGTKKIFANAGTITGSIGVIMQFADLSKLYDWAKVHQYNIKTGRYKDIGSPNREMTPEEKALLQGMIDNVLDQFRKAVAKGRSLPMEKVVEVSDGRIFSGEQAKNVKLVDEVGGFNDAVAALAKEVGIEGKPKLVYASKKKRGFERLFGDLDDDAEGNDSHFLGSLLTLMKAASEAAGGVSKGLDRLSSAGGVGFSGPLFVAPRLLTE